MVRVSTWAATLGVTAGAWNLYEYYFLVCHSYALECAVAFPPGFQGVVFASLSILLLLVSLGEFFGPMELYYVSTVLGLAIDLVEALNYSGIAQGPFYVTTILTTLGVVLSFVAARRMTGVSEQANPMNLPIFG